MGTQIKLKDGVKKYYDNNKIMMDLELGKMGLQDIRVHLETHLQPDHQWLSFTSWATCWT